MMRAYLTVALILRCVLPQPVAAAGEEGSWGWVETIGRWFNLAILFGILIYFTRQPLTAFFNGQRKQIQRELAQALEAQRRAEEQLAEVQAKMANLDAELEGLRQQAIEESERERERIRIESEAEAERLVETAEREVDGLLNAARHRLREYASALAMELAAARARDSINDDTDGRLIERFLTELENQRDGKVQ